MLQQFEPGDYLIFQLESGYALLRVLAVDGSEGDPVWHLAAFNELFLDVDSAEAAINTTGALTTLNPHLALTDHAFESTQVAKMGNAPLADEDRNGLVAWRNDPDRKIHDRSIRLLLGLR